MAPHTLARWSAIVLAAVLGSACGGGAAGSPPALGVQLPGETADTPCEDAVVARAEYLRDEGVDGSERLESDIFAACSYEQFRAANAEMIDRFRYPGDGRQYVGRNCLRLFAIYRGSRLCRTR